MLWLSFFWRSLANARKSTTPPAMASAATPLPKLVDNPPAPNSVPEPLRSKSTKTESMDPRWWWWWWWLPWCELRNGWWQGDEVGDVMGEVNDEGGPDVNPDPDPFNPASLLSYFRFHIIKNKNGDEKIKKRETKPKPEKSSAMAFTIILLNNWMRKWEKKKKRVQQIIFLAQYNILDSSDKYILPAVKAPVMMGT